MEFRTIPCHATLQPFIRNYWLLTAHATAEGTVRIYSNGAASLHFYLAQPVRWDDGDCLYTTSFNRHDRPVETVTTPAGDFSVLGVEFVPFCSYLFLRPPASLSHASTEDMADADFSAAAAAVHAAPTTAKQVQCLDDFFLRRLSAVSPSEAFNMARMSDVFRDLIPATGCEAAPMPPLLSADLAASACLGTKQFGRIFSATVGMRPKAYLRLLRFHSALRALRQAPAEQTLSDIAWATGYYDASHMISDFRDLSGYTPAEVRTLGSRLTETFGDDFSSKMKKKIVTAHLV